MKIPQLLAGKNLYCVRGGQVVVPARKFRQRATMVNKQHLTGERSSLGVNKLTSTINSL